MCERYALESSARQVTMRFAVSTKSDCFDDRVRYNIAPGQDIPVIVVNHWPPYYRKSPRTLESKQWGLIPEGTDDLAQAEKPIYADAEMITENETFKYAVTERRCLVPATGFFVCQQQDGKEKQPMFFHRKDHAPFAIAGIWEECEDFTDGWWAIHSVAIITTVPNPLVAPLHNRMPAILLPEDEDAWLDHSLPIQEALSLLRPYPGDWMDVYSVDPQVNDPENDNPLCIEPMTPNGVRLIWLDEVVGYIADPTFDNRRVTGRWTPSPTPIGERFIATLGRGEELIVYIGQSRFQTSGVPDKHIDLTDYSNYLYRPTKTDLGIT
jgi:putative SOS response-associated peptidase YedK